MKVINISVDEFIKEINRYLEGPDELILERNGQIIGHYRPRKEKKEVEIQLSFERLKQAIDREHLIFVKKLFFCSLFPVPCSLKAITFRPYSKLRCTQ